MVVDGVVEPVGFGLSVEVNGTGEEEGEERGREGGEGEGEEVLGGVVTGEEGALGGEGVEVVPGKVEVSGALDGGARVVGSTDVGKLVGEDMMVKVNEGDQKLEMNRGGK